MAKKDSTGFIKARVLTECGYGAPDDVVETDASDIAIGVESGLLDSNPDAVAYAESLKAGE
jgi:hypothetical protein